MPAYKEKGRQSWYVITYFKDADGIKKQKCKRGFATKRDALKWEQDFLLQDSGQLDMTFESFFERYKEEKNPRIRENTQFEKEYLIRSKILPFFGKMQMNEITARDITIWQNELLRYRNNKGEPYSDTYLRTINAQLSAIFNHAVRYYDLECNPVHKAGLIGSSNNDEMKYWTKAEYLRFAEAVMDKPMSFYAFEMLYWTGIRLGELLALTPEDFDFEKKCFRVNKSYQRIKREDVITPPKTKKSIRTVLLPDFLCEEIQECIRLQYALKSTDRIFAGINKPYLHHEMDRGAKAAGIKRIRVHDLRHSHISLLIDMGFSPLAIADRVGHESITITYRYAHLFPDKQKSITNKLDIERGGNDVG